MQWNVDTILQFKFFLKLYLRDIKANSVSKPRAFGARRCKSIAGPQRENVRIWEYLEK